MMAQKGQVQSQITDSYLKQMLEGISDGVRRRPRHSVPRARAMANANRARRRGPRRRRRPARLSSPIPPTPCPSRCSQGGAQKATIQIDRRRFGDDSDSDVDLEGL